jgi:hypothetical protein
MKRSVLGLVAASVAGWMWTRSEARGANKDD